MTSELTLHALVPLPKGVLDSGPCAWWWRLARCQMVVFSGKKHHVGTPVPTNLWVCNLWAGSHLPHFTRETHQVKVTPLDVVTLGLVPTELFPCHFLPFSPRPCLDHRKHTAFLCEVKEQSSKASTFS